MSEQKKYSGVVRNKYNNPNREYCIIESTQTSKAAFVRDLRANGYAVDPKRVRLVGNN